MDFAETKAAAAREIALAFGVPPLLPGLPGDNAYRNDEDANRGYPLSSTRRLVGRLMRFAPGTRARRSR
jgi:phage portal protein BeeE